MTSLERDIRTCILLALLATKGSPMPDDSLKRHICNMHPNVAFSAGELTDHVRDCETDNLIAGTNDEVFGRMWALTPKGKIRAQQLR